MMNEYRKLAFDLKDLPRYVDLNVPPATGFDYLYRVRLEAKNCPDVVVSNIDTTKFAQRQNVKIDFCTGFTPAPPGYKPDLEWQKQQIELFKYYREQLEHNFLMLKAKFPKRDYYPKIFKLDEWCFYSLGPEKHKKIYCNLLTETSGDEKLLRLRKKFGMNHEGTPPLLSIILHLPQYYIIRLISYHLMWLEASTFTRGQGQWLYALLLRLETPFEPDTCALLRSLSRVCSKLRAEIADTQDEALTAFNIFIVIIAVFFGQKDMSDEYMPAVTA